MAAYYTISDMQEIAALWGGRCLSKHYINDHTKLEWQCKKGHTWDTTFGTIRGGAWCPGCYMQRVKYSIEDMKEIAAKKGGKCHGIEYVNILTPLEWECAKGHRWKIGYNVIQQGGWCPACFWERITLSIDKMHEVATNKGGKCLSKKYVNNATPLKWKCGKGHTWETPYSIIQQGSWCPLCHGNFLYTIKQMREIAAKKGGKCLSKKYPNNNTHLQWQCAKKHTWKAKYNSIQQGSWCPVCARKRRPKLLKA